MLHVLAGRGCCGTVGGMSVSVAAVHCPVVLARTMEAADANVLGNVHGGVVLREVDSAAGVAAARYCGRVAVTAAFDSMAFLSPVHVGDVLTCRAAVTWTGRTSLEVGVRIEAESWSSPGVPRHVGSAYLVFVPLGDDGGPVAVPGLSPVDEVGRRWWREGQLRREARLALREAIARGRRGDSA